MAFSYPVTLNLEGKRCLVVGGGQVALRKVRSLVQQQAQVEVVSPKLTLELDSLWQQGAFKWHETCYEATFLQGNFLVIAATNQKDINRQIAEDCNVLGILVNVVDDKEASNFIVNACHIQGDLLIAVSTNGVSPAIARDIKEELMVHYGTEYGDVLRILKDIRQEALETIADADKRRAFLLSLSKMELIEEIKNTSFDDVQKRVRKCLSSYWD